MKKTFYTFLILALLAGFPQAAHAEYEDGERVSAATIAPLMAWVAKETGVRIATQPTVEASRTKLLKIVSHMGPIAGHARALYVGGTVLLDSSLFDPEEATQMSFLVHELVHYAQAQRTVPTGSCAKAKEFEAYTLQNKWLEENGHAPIVSASWINRMASCPVKTTTIAMADAR